VAAESRADEPTDLAGAPEQLRTGGGLWSRQRRALTTGLVLTITFIASEALAVVTIMPVVAKDLRGLSLYGWVFSAFMLGNVIGIVTAGRQADRYGPARPFLGGLALFCAGLAVAGSAPTMLVLVGGRALQGIGAGAVPAVAYVAIGRSLPENLRARMMAVLSTAWVLPGMVGPAISAAVASFFGWRVVFLGLIPLVVVTGALALPGLARLGKEPPGDASATDRPGNEHRFVDGLVAAMGAALTLAGLSRLTSGGQIVIGLGLLAGGLAAVYLSLRRLLPAGTITARRGLPAVILCRGLLTFTFFGADAYVTLTITTVRGHSPALAGVAVTGATLAWTAGAWVQARLNSRVEARTLIGWGLIVIIIGLAAMALVLLPEVPVYTGLAAWTVAGFGMGLAYAPISLLMLREAPAGREGWASASLTLADVLGTALGIGVGGAAVAAATAHGWPLALGVGAAFAIASAGGLVLAVASRRLPRARTGSYAGPAGVSSREISGSGPASSSGAAGV
jgi:MFS family permease